MLARARTLPVAAVLSLVVTGAAGRAVAQTCKNPGYSITPPNLTMLPDAFVGVPYAQTVTASGGSATRYWQMNAGTLPMAGIKLQTPGAGGRTNTIAGTPTTTGEQFTITVCADDTGTPDPQCTCSAGETSATYLVAVRDRPDAGGDGPPDAMTMEKDAGADAPSPPDAGPDTGADAPPDLRTMDKDAGADTAPDVMMCVGAGQMCNSAGDCCGSLRCEGATGGRIAGSCCADRGGACNADQDCCGTQRCNAGACGDCQMKADLGCSTDRDCCGDYKCIFVGTKGVCHLSKCSGAGDLCMVSGDCCDGFACVGGSASSFGYCQQAASKKGCAVASHSAGDTSAPIVMLLVSAGVGIGRRVRRRHLRDRSR